MPIYEYLCGNCGRSFEQLQRMIDDPLTIDPECGGPVRRVIQPVGIIFKGSGFYATDSRKANSASSTSESGSKSESGSNASSEAKTKTKGDSAGGSADASKKSEPKSSGDAKPAAVTAAKD